LVAAAYYGSASFSRGARGLWRLNGAMIFKQKHAASIIDDQDGSAIFLN
jgi:hypothetical protein